MPPKRLLQALAAGLLAALAALIVVVGPWTGGHTRATSVPPTPAPPEEPLLCVGPNGPADAGCRWAATEHSLIVRIEGAAAGADHVVVVYGNEEEGYYRTGPAPVEGGRYAVHIGRLRAETAYEFRVFLNGTMAETDLFATGYFTTGPLPEGLQRAQIDVRTGEPTNDLTFMDFNVDEYEDEPPFHGLVAIDGDGEIVWYAETGETNAMARRPNGNIVFIEYEFGLREITPLGETVAALQSPCLPDILYHHEVELLPDGRVLTLGYDIRDSLGDPERLQVGDTIWVWDPEDGSVRQEWSLFDFIHPAFYRTERSSVREGFMWYGCEAVLPTEDWSHANSVKVAPNGDVIFSMRHLDQVISISPDFRTINWRLGGPGGYFSFPDPEDRFYHQHTAHQLPNGNILLFDNGNTRPDEEGGEYSRALELELDLRAMTARKVWEYAPSSPIFSICCSSVERLPNGNTLVLFSPDPEDEGNHATLVEADPEGEVVWEAHLSAPGQRVIYRASPGDTILGETRVLKQPSPALPRTEAY